MKIPECLTGKVGFLLSIALLATLTGCIYAHPPSAVYVSPPPVEAGVVIQDDYVYYPGYQVYYSSSRRQYVYQEGRAWVTRPAPPHVSVGVLFASPSVRLDFHDSPAAHHTAVVRQYPKHWAPPKADPSHREEKRDEGRGDDRGGHR